MNRFKVNTNNIVSIGYDEVNEILEIEKNRIPESYLTFTSYESLQFDVSGVDGDVVCVLMGTDHYSDVYHTQQPARQSRTRVL